MSEVLSSPAGPAPASKGRLAVFEAALEACVVDGYDGTLIDENADHLGASGGGDRRYDRGKADIFLDIHPGVVSWRREQIEVRAARKVAPDALLHALAVRHVELLLERLPFARVSLQTLGHSVGANRRQHTVTAKVKDLRDRYEQVFTQTNADGVAAGVLRTVDPHVAPKPLLGALNWTVMWFDPDGQGIPGERHSAELATFVVEGLRAR